jgi:hypothetical protein
MSELKLIEVAKSGDISSIESLINSGEDIEQVDEYGWTALNWAAGRGHTDAIRKLLDAGANIAHTGRDNRTSYLIALAAAHIESATLLQEAEQKAGMASAQVRPYCKAYPLDALRKFPDWHESQAALDSDAVVYLHQDLSVTRSILHGEDVVFDRQSSSWTTFCRQQLAFLVPTEMALAAAFVAGKRASRHGESL